MNSATALQSTIEPPRAAACAPLELLPFAGAVFFDSFGNWPA